MAGVLSLDIETSNYSHEIGGWDKTHMFEPTVVATYNGDDATIFCNQDITVKGATVLPLHPRDVGEHLMKHIEGGGTVVGHNIVAFDLPVLRDALDCHVVGRILTKHKDQLIDTAHTLRKASSNVGKAYHIKLNDVCKRTLAKAKTMSSHEAPLLWKHGDYDDVASYCLNDATLNWELVEHGMNTGIVKSRSRWTGEIVKLEVDWKWAKGEDTTHRKHNS